MKIPDRKSLTRVWAPKPSATPTIPAEARRGATETPNSAKTIKMTIVETKSAEVERNTDPRVRARWARRCAAAGFVARRAFEISAGANFPRRRFGAFGSPVEIG